MLYVIPASSALHFDAQPRYHCGQPPALLPRYPYYHGYHPSDVAEAILREEALKRYNQELRLHRQAEEVSRRRLLQSIYAAELQQQREMEYARAIAIVAARRQQIEESVRRNAAAKIFLHRPKQVDIQEELLALLSDGGSTQPEQTLQNQAPTIQRCGAIRRPIPCNPVAEKLNTRLRRETDPEITETLRSILGTLFSDQSQAAAAEPSRSAVRQDKGKGKAPVEDVIDPKPEPEVKTLERAIQEYLEDFFRPVPRPSEAGPSGTSPAEPALKKDKHVSFEEKLSIQKPEASTATSKSSVPEPTTTDSEAQAAERARTQALSSIQQIKTTLNTLESEFHLPVTLDHYPTPPLDHDDTASVSSTASDLSRLLPYTSNNASVHAYENTLGTLLEQLDGVESGGDLEVREARREVVRDVEKALSVVESAIEDEITKRAEPGSEGALVLESQSGEVVGYSVDGATAEADLEVPSTSPAPETAAPVAEVPDVQSTDTESGDSESLVANTSGKHPDLTLEALPVSPSEAAHEISVASLQGAQLSEISVDHSPEAEEATAVETPSDAPVEEVDTFLLAAQSVSPVVRNRSESDEIEDDGAVVVDAERDEWLEV